MNKTTKYDKILKLILNLLSFFKSKNIGVGNKLLMLLTIFVILFVGYNIKIPVCLNKSNGHIIFDLNDLTFKKLDLSPKEITVDKESNYTLPNLEELDKDSFLSTINKDKIKNDTSLLPLNFYISKGVFKKYRHKLRCEENCSNKIRDVLIKETKEFLISNDFDVNKKNILDTLKFGRTGFKRKNKK